MFVIFNYIQKENEHKLFVFNKTAYFLFVCLSVFFSNGRLFILMLYSLLENVWTW